MGSLLLSNPSLFLYKNYLQFFNLLQGYAYARVYAGFVNDLFIEKFLVS